MLMLNGKSRGTITKVIRREGQTCSRRKNKSGVLKPREERGIEERGVCIAHTGNAMQVSGIQTTIKHLYVTTVKYLIIKEDDERSECH
jgi:hypothetical protein